jgi:hypothetical protein
MVVNNQVHYQIKSNDVKHGIEKATKQKHQNTILFLILLLLVILEDNLLLNEVLLMYFHKEEYLLVQWTNFHDYNQRLLYHHVVFDYYYICVIEPNYKRNMVI